MKSFFLYAGVFILVTAGAAAAGTLRLNPETQSYELAPWVEILEDPSHSLSFEEVLKNKGQAFTPNPHGTIDIGRTKAAVWFRFKLSPSDPDPDSAWHNWFLEVGKQGIGSIDLYVPVVSGRGEHQYRKIEFGTWQPYPPEHIPSRASVVALPHHWAGDAWFFLRVKSDISINFPLRIQSPRAFVRQSLPDFYGFGILFGILLGMILYNFAIFLFLRNRIYLFYVLYIFSMFWYITLVYGHFELMFKPSPDKMRLAFFAASGSVWLFGGTFSRLFLNTRAYAPVMDRLILGVIAAGLMVACSAFAGFHYLAHQLNSYIGIIGPPIAVLAAVRVWRQKFPPAKYFLAAWLVLMAGAILYSMGGVFIPRSPITVYTFAVGAGIEAVLLSLALADRIRLLQREKEQLRQSETQLRQAAVTDSLTGLFNRRFLLETLDKEVRVAQSSKKPLSLLILDVDCFKRFNDTYGHPEGDKVLAAMAVVLSEQLREKDSPCRYGGEEFVVILPHVELSQALGVAERIRSAFSEQIFHPVPGEEIHVTVSIGSAELQPGEEGQEMIRRADKALYQAKNDGRNRVVPA